jgi:hypothetical protein
MTMSPRIRDLSTRSASFASGPVARTPFKKRLMPWLRKTHMYLGLVLAPWVVFFGVSGMLFNHPGVGEAVEARPLSPALLRDQAQLAPLDVGALARDVVRELAQPGESYLLDESFAAELHGSTALATDSKGQKHLVLLHLPSARGIVLSRPDHTPPHAPFAGKLAKPPIRLDELSMQLSPLLPSLGIPESDAQRLTLRTAPSLRFRMVDQAGQRWNVTYDLGSGRVDGRPSGRSPDLSLHDLLGAMHKTHHYPKELGPTTFWALLADLTGLTLVLWALTGIAMWWQLKRTRMLGLLALSAGLLVAALVMLGNHRELRFGNVQPEEPGGAPLPVPTAPR